MIIFPFILLLNEWKSCSYPINQRILNISSNSLVTRFQILLSTLNPPHFTMLLRLIGRYCRVNIKISTTLSIRFPAAVTSATILLSLILFREIEIPEVRIGYHRNWGNSWRPFEPPFARFFWMMDWRYIYHHRQGLPYPLTEICVEDTIPLDATTLLLASRNLAQLLKARLMTFNEQNFQ